MVLVFVTVVPPRRLFLKVVVLVKTLLTHYGSFQCDSRKRKVFVREACISCNRPL